MIETVARVRGEALPVTLLWAVVNLIQAVLAVAWTIVCFFVTLLTGLALWRRSAALDAVRRVWAPPVLALLGARLAVTAPADPPSGAVLFVANHQSSLDIPALFAALPVPLYFLVKRELAVVPIVGWFCRAIGMVFVDRRGGDRAHASIDRMAEVLESGRSMVAFPEGTRGVGDERRPFKRGPFVAAIKAGVPVVPVAIDGTAKVVPPRGLRLRPGRVALHVGAALPTEGLDLEDRQSLAERAERAIERSRAPEPGGPT